jgi:ferredoxin
LYTVIYFSPTGNVRHLANTLVGLLGSKTDEAIPLESVAAERLTGGGDLVLLYPIHGFNPPRNVKRFVEHLPAGLFDTVSLVAVGCTDHWVDGAVSARLRRTLVRKDYHIGAEMILAMPLTFIMAFPDAAARNLIAESEKALEVLAASLGSAKHNAPHIPWKSRFVSFLGRLESPASRLFGLELHASEGCTSCGTCWNHCPERNIRRGKDGKPRFGFACLMCMRCIYNCPENAISPRISKFIPIKGGYSLSRYTDEQRRSS